MSRVLNDELGDDGRGCGAQADYAMVRSMTAYELAKETSVSLISVGDLVTHDGAEWIVEGMRSYPNEWALDLRALPDAPNQSTFVLVALNDERISTRRVKR
jgi:hypothetical protein